MKLTKLIEATIKDLIDLNTRFNDFSKKKINYIGFSFRNKIVYFKTGKYIQKVQIPGLKIISKMKGSIKEKISMALSNEDIKVYCSCPDFKYGGFMYIGTQTGYSLHKENRPPVRNNPNQTGSVCKHLNFLLQDIEKHTDDIVADYKTTSKTGKTIIHDKSLASQIKTLGLKRK